MRKRQRAVFGQFLCSGAVVPMKSLDPSVIIQTFMVSSLPGRYKTKIKGETNSSTDANGITMPYGASIVRTFTAPGRNFKTDYLRYIDTNYLI